MISNWLINKIEGKRLECIRMEFTESGRPHKQPSWKPVWRHPMGWFREQF